MINIFYVGYFYCKYVDLKIEEVDIGKENVFEMFVWFGLYWIINIIWDNLGGKWLELRVCNFGKGKE